MICFNSAFEQGNLDLWRYINAFIIIIIIIMCVASTFKQVLVTVNSNKCFNLICCDITNE